MKISNKQLMMLVDILKASLPLVDSSSFTLAYSQEQRVKLANQIINQQSKKLKEIYK